MSDKPISVGDLVYVAKRAVCCDSFLGHHFKVTGLRTVNGSNWWQCAECGATGFFNGTYSVADGYLNGFPLTRLKRIPPLDELEGVRQDEEISA